MESPIQALLKAGRAGRASGQQLSRARYRRLGLAIILATVIATTVFLGWLARHAGL